MKALFGALIFSGLCVLVAAAAPLTRPLAPGLTYLRAAALPADLATATSTGGSWVLDLRYTPDAPGDVAALTGWLHAHATARTPVFVLADAATGGALRSALAARPPPADTLVIGIPGPGFTPDIAVQADAAEARKAYDALPATPDIRALVVYAPPKARFDEQAMVKAQQENNDFSQAPTGSGEDDAPTDEAAAAPAATAPSPPPLLDHALQRAVQIYEGWQALLPN